jgi:hypothetical protein
VFLGDYLPRKCGVATFAFDQQGAASMLGEGKTGEIFAELAGNGSLTVAARIAQLIPDNLQSCVR